MDLLRQVFEDLLWVWLASGPEEHIHAAAKRPNATPELDDLPPGTEVHTVSKWFQRDLPYDWTVSDSLSEVAVQR